MAETIKCLCKETKINYHPKCPMHGAAYPISAAPYMFEKEIKNKQNDKKIS